MFGRRKKTTISVSETVLPPPPPAPKEHETVLAAPMTLKGADFDGPDGDLVIHGKALEGCLNVRKLTIAAGGEVSGKVICHTLVVRGRIAGDIKVHQALFEEQSVMVGVVAYTGQFAAKPGARILGPLIHEATKEFEAPDFLAIAPQVKALAAPSQFQGSAQNPSETSARDPEFASISKDGS